MPDEDIIIIEEPEEAIEEADDGEDENLFPEDDIESSEDDADEEVVGYKESLYFDETEGDILRDGQFRIKTSTGIESWKQWCINCLLTERDQYPAYGSKFGIATFDAFASGDRNEIESTLTREISESLMNDPYGRTEYVDGIEFNWGEPAPDSLSVSMTVHGIDDVTIDITTTINTELR